VDYTDMITVVHNKLQNGIEIFIDVTGADFFNRWHAMISAFSCGEPFSKLLTDVASGTTKGDISKAFDIATQAR
jgi:hypothetical protein